MSAYGVLSLLPPLLAIILALRTRQVYISLVAGIWLGWLIINKGNVFLGTLATLEAFVDVFASAGNTRTIMFSALVGSLLMLIQYSGGVQGFIVAVNKKLEKHQAGSMARGRLLIQLLAALTGLLLFIETTISALTTGALYRPLFDKYKISREKLAYLADSTAAPSSILIPLNAWGAFLMGLLLSQGIDHPLKALSQALLYNFYPMLTIALVFIIVLTGKDFGPMKKAEMRVRESGMLLNEGSRPLVSDEVTGRKMKEGIKPAAINMIIPLLTMILMMPLSLAYTGWNEVEAGPSFFGHLGKALGHGSGSSAVLYAVVSALLVAMILYRAQRLMKTREMVELSLKGIGELMPLALLMMLAFAISAVCKQLGTGLYLAHFTGDWLSPKVLPFVIFLLSAFIAFSTGTSWGTFAIMISIAIPMAEVQGANLSLVLAASIGGGVFGDHCSPISDTTIISSMSAATDHIDHVKTQLPYALVTGGLTGLLYLIMGFIL